MPARVHYSIFNVWDLVQEYFPTFLSIIPSSLPFAAWFAPCALKHRGATVLPVSLSNTLYALSAYYVIACAEASSTLARYDGVQYGLHVPLPPDSVTPALQELYTHNLVQPGLAQK